MASERYPTHPGRILREEFLNPLGLTAYRLCKETGMPQDRVSRILAGTRGVTADTALRLARFFGTTPEFWMNLQTGYDLERAERESGKAIEKRVRPLRAD
ncbi:MAG: HigA family addiction module antidote protein [Fimbriimonadaceae bacterium]|nr:HigA family addiction module antidote protein [Fimbriimonadaceae bacterium]